MLMKLLPPVSAKLMVETEVLMELTVLTPPALALPVGSRPMLALRR